MFKIFIYTLLAIFAGLLAALFVAREPGYLLVSFADFTLETSLFALFVAAAALLILLRLLVLVVDLINPRRLLNWGRRFSRTRVPLQSDEGSLSGPMLRDALYADLEAQLKTKHKRALTFAELSKMWMKHTKEIIPDDALISLYVDALVYRDGLNEAVRVLETTLKWGTSALLVRKYSLLGLRLSDSDALQQLRNAEAWLELRPTDAPLLLALGRISLRNRLWEKARKYFERSLREQASTEVFAELARLLKNLQVAERKSKFLAEEIRLVSQSLPDFPQPTVSFPDP